MKNKLLTLLIALIASVGTLFAGSPVARGEQQVNGIWYLFDHYNNTATVTYHGAWENLILDYYSGEITIPSAVEYHDTIYTITRIGEYAFYNCSGLTSVEIPNSVTSIVDYAFYNCSGLTSVEIPNSVTSIGDYAFSGCTGLTSVEIPNSVTSIGYSAFYDCTSLTSLTIGNSLTWIGRDAFYNCSGLTSVEIPNSVTRIGDYAFSNVANIVYEGSATGSPWGARSINGYVEGWLVYRDESKTELLACSSGSNGELTIPNSVTSIGEKAFNNCSSMTSIEIPNSVTSIGYEAFNNCFGLMSVYISDIATWCGISFDVTYSNPLSQAHNLYLNEELVTDLVIPNSVTSIGNYAFSGCSALTSIDIPNSVISIGDYTFDGCTALISVTIPNSVTSIGNHTFFDCSGLRSIDIPNSVTSIGNYAFSGCTGLTSVTISNSVTSIGDYAFYNCSGLTSVEIPNSVTSIGGLAFYGCTGLTSIEIPNSVTSIGNRAFSNVANIVYEGSATGSPWGARSINGYVEGWLVYRDESKTELLACSSGENGELTIPNSVTSIGNRAFYNCSGLTSVTIPNSVTDIGSDAFSYCTGLTSVEIPNSVTSIGYYAFSNVANIVYEGSATGSPWGARSINGYVEGWLVYRDESKTELLACSSGANGELTIPNSVTSIGNRAFYNCSGLTSVTIPNSVTSIGDYAFSGCTGLTSPLYNAHVFAFMPITYAGSYAIPDAIEIIAIGAFYNCSGLTSIDIPNSVTSIGYEAFFYCWNLTDIYVACGDLDRIKQLLNNDGRVKYRPLPLITTHALNGDVNIISNICEPVVLTALPDYGYHFTQWSDGNTDNPRTIVLTQDTTFTAEFAIDKSGTCGANNELTWSYDDQSHTLTITGDGALTENYTFGLEAPTQMTTLIIGDGVTEIGEGAFYGMSTINHLFIGANVASIGINAFAECRNFDDITCYSTNVPVINATTFANVGNKQYIYLYVPENRERAYQRDEFWGEFDIQIKGAEATTTDTNNVIVEPADNTALFRWPVDDDADSYSLQITKDGEVFCTLVFNNNGQLTGIAFAPSRDRSSQMPAAIMSVSAMSFTVTGLDAASKYSYRLSVTDEALNEIQAYSGEFATTGYEGEINEGGEPEIIDTDGIEEVVNIVNCQSSNRKFMIDGQFFILRGEEIFNAQGARVR